MIRKRPDLGTPSTPRRALLVFADVAALDLARRRWPRYLAPALVVSRPDLLAGDADCHLFTRLCCRSPARDTRVETHVQNGRDFGERLTAAVETLASRGYDEIVIVGGDCPDLQPSDVACAFDGLSRHRLVLGPDHKGGVYLIGLRATDRKLLQGVQWLRNTDCDQLVSAAEIESTLLLPTKSDLDTIDDLRLLAAGFSHVSFLARRLLQRLAFTPTLLGQHLRPQRVLLGGAWGRSPPIG